MRSTQPQLTTLGTQLSKKKRNEKGQVPIASLREAVAALFWFSDKTLKSFILDK